jgi:hypothetical protein
MQPARLTIELMRPVRSSARVETRVAAAGGRRCSGPRRDCSTATRGRARDLLRIRVATSRGRRGRRRRRACRSTARRAGGHRGAVSWTTRRLSQHGDGARARFAVSGARSDRRPTGSACGYRSSPEEPRAAACRGGRRLRQRDQLAPPYKSHKFITRPQPSRCIDCRRRVVCLDAVTYREPHGIESRTACCTTSAAMAFGADVAARAVALRTASKDGVERGRFPRRHDRARRPDGFRYVPINRAAERTVRSCVQSSRGPADVDLPIFGFESENFVRCREIAATTRRTPVIATTRR